MNESLKWVEQLKEKLTSWKLATISHQIILRIHVNDFFDDGHKCDVVKLLNTVMKIMTQWAGSLDHGKRRAFDWDGYTTYTYKMKNMFIESLGYQFYFRSNSII